MLLLEPNPLTDLYRVYSSNELWLGEVLVKVPVGYEYDGASIPIYLQPFMGSSFSPKYMEAALYHDYLYGNHILTKAQADSLFHSILVLNGVSKTKAMLMYRAVQEFGQPFWDKGNESINK